MAAFFGRLYQAIQRIIRNIQEKKNGTTYQPIFQKLLQVKCRVILWHIGFYYLLCGAFFTWIAPKINKQKEDNNKSKNERTQK